MEKEAKELHEQKAKKLRELIDSIDFDKQKDAFYSALITKDNFDNITVSEDIKGRHSELLHSLYTALKSDKATFRLVSGALTIRMLENMKNERIYFLHLLNELNQNHNRKTAHIVTMSDNKSDAYMNAIDGEDFELVELFVYAFKESKNFYHAVLSVLGDELINTEK